MPPARFKKTIWAHYRSHGRHDLPWRRARDPYHVLVSEVMLQQTQAARVEKYYKKWIARFPNFRALARAKTADVLKAWQSLGYNRRALALQKLSRIVLEKFNGRLPRDPRDLESLPGIGPYTARAIRAFAWNEPDVLIETNIRRVFIHFFFPRKKEVTDGALERYIKSTLDRKNPREWYSALMDYGAMLGAQGANGRERRKDANPNRRSAHYKKQPRFSGSDRELRGKILRFLVARGKLREPGLAKRLKESKARIAKILGALEKEGFVERKNNSIRITT